MSSPVLPGAEPWSHHGSTAVGALVLHGFTGNPSSVRILAEALGAAGHHVELPRLPGHGTVVDDMYDTGWADWTGEVAAAHERLRARVDTIVVAGLSMGGSLTLWAGLHLPDIVGLVCVNPLTVPQPDVVLEMIDEMLEEGTQILPGIGSDIADPEAVEISYEGTPLQPLASLMRDGVATMTDRYGELRVPLRLFTSHQDHVVEPANSEHLAATYGGPVEHTWLERSYHVATQDYDKHLIVDETLAFVARVTGA
jgi:carboxylesterase